MDWGKCKEAASRSCSCCECCLVRRVGPRGVTPRMVEIRRVLGSEGVVLLEELARRWLRWYVDKEVVEEMMEVDVSCSRVES